MKLKQIGAGIVKAVKNSSKKISSVFDRKTQKEIQEAGAKLTQKTNPGKDEVFIKTAEGHIFRRKK